MFYIFMNRMSFQFTGEDSILAQIKDQDSFMQQMGHIKQEHASSSTAKSHVYHCDVYRSKKKPYQWQVQIKNHTDTLISGYKVQSSFDLAVLLKDFSL